MGMGPAGVIFFGMIVIVGVAVLAVVILLVTLVRGVRRRAHREGYTSVRAYLAAAPRTDEERRDSVDLALKGLVICVVGFLFPPLVLVGVVPLFYGARKLAYASLGLGLIDESDDPGA